MEEQKRARDRVVRRQFWWALAALAGTYILLLSNYDALTDFCCLHISDSTYQRIMGQSLEVFYDTSFGLLGTAISAIAIIASFLDQRYLGANYKNWMFKNTPYFLTPQACILLMVVNLAGYLPHLITGGFRLVACVSFLISWWLFLYLLYLVYVYVIKVSHMFRKFAKKIQAMHDDEQWGEFCKSLYEKLITIPGQDKHNSYFSDETKVILQLMIIYREKHQIFDADASRRNGWKKALSCMIENEAHVRCNQFDRLTDNDAQASQNDAVGNKIEQARVVLVRKVVDMGNELPGNTGREYPYVDAENAQQNLEEAFKSWFF